MSDEDTIKQRLDELRGLYPDATHHCYAWVLGHEAEKHRSNDDGEPGNSAGKPIYRQIISKNLTNVLIVVVRYYGGTKLGIPGLIQAYGAAAEAAINTIRLIEKELTITAIVEGPVGEEHLVFVVSNRLGGSAEVLELSDRFKLKCTIPKANEEEFIATSKMWHKFDIKITE